MIISRLFNSSPDVALAKEVQLADKKSLSKIVLDNMKTNQFDQLQAIQKTISLPQLKKLCEIEEPTALAQAEASLLTYDLQVIDSRSSYFSIAYSYAFKAMHAMLHYVLLNGIGRIISIVENIYYQTISNPISIAFLSYQWNYVENAFSQLKSFHELTHSYVHEKTENYLASTVYAAKVPPISKTLAYAAEAAVIGMTVGLYYLYSYYNVKLANSLKKSDFEDLTEKARLGELTPTIGGSEYTDPLIRQLSWTPLGKGVIVFLIGPSGVGKTQSAFALATLIAQEDVPLSLRGKSVLSINTAQLTSSPDKMEHKIDKILSRIEGNENRVVLFFDEARSLKTEKGGDALIQILKTKIPEKNITVIFATTQIEYDKYIATDDAFTSRTRPIIFGEPSDEQTALIIHEVATKLFVEIDTDAIEKIIELMKTRPRYKDQYNPRKSLNAFEDCIKQLEFLSSSSLTSSTATSTANNEELKKLTSDCREKNKQIPGWLMSPEGKQALKAIKALELAIQSDKELRKEAYKVEAFKRKILDQQKEYYKQIGLLAFQLIDPKLNASTWEALEKEYLFTKFFLAPQSTQACEELKIPYKIDIALVESQFPPAK